MTKEQKRHYRKWTLIAAAICGCVAAAAFLISGSCGLQDGMFWFQVFVVAGGGGYTLGLLPAILLDFRKPEHREDEKGGQDGSF